MGNKRTNRKSQKKKKKTSCENEGWNRSLLLFIQTWFGIYVTYGRLIKQLCSRELKEKNFDCLELVLKSYLHVHLIKMMSFNCRHKIHDQGEQKIKKRTPPPRPPTTQICTYLNESDRLKIPLQLHDKMLTLYFPFFPSGPTKTDDLSASVKRHSSASNLNSESIMLDRARVAKTFLTSMWR